MRSLHSPRRALTAALAVLAATRALPAQAVSQPLPPELVTALFGGGSSAGADTRYYVGIVPPGWPAQIVPAAPIGVLGGMRTGSRVVAVFADSTVRMPQDRVRKQIEDAGWTQPPMAQEREGFTSNTFQNDDGHYGFWCRDSVRATMTPVRAASALTFVRLTLETLRSQPCVPAQSASLHTDRTMLALPLLFPPERVHQTGGEGSSSGHSMSRSTQLADSVTTPAAMLAHYAAQLSKAGWTTRPPVTDAHFASQALEARDNDGRPWYGMLIVFPSAKTRDVSIMMSRMVTP